MNEDEKKAVEFLKENLLNYEEIDTSILLDINSKHKTLLNLIEKLQKEYNKLDEQIEEYINDGNKDLSKYYENKEKIGKMQMLSYFIDNLQELMEESEES